MIYGWFSLNLGVWHPRGYDLMPVLLLLLRGLQRFKWKCNFDFGFVHCCLMPYVFCLLHSKVKGAQHGPRGESTVLNIYCCSLLPNDVGLESFQITAFKFHVFKLPVQSFWKIRSINSTSVVTFHDFSKIFYENNDWKHVSVMKAVAGGNKGSFPGFAIVVSSFFYFFFHQFSSLVMARVLMSSCAVLNENGS